MYPSAFKQYYPPQHTRTLSLHLKFDILKLFNGRGRGGKKGTMSRLASHGILFFRAAMSPITSGYLETHCSVLRWRWRAMENIHHSSPRLLQHWGGLLVHARAHTLRGRKNEERYVTPSDCFTANDSPLPVAVNYLGLLGLHLSWWLWCKIRTHTYPSCFICLTDCSYVPSSCAGGALSRWSTSKQQFISPPLTDTHIKELIVSQYWEQILFLLARDGFGEAWGI